jgi:hypothetical protein
MLEEKDAIKEANVVKGQGIGQDSDGVKGNEAEEFIKKIVLKILFSTIVIIVGVGIAVYYTSGAV